MLRSGIASGVVVLLLATAACSNHAPRHDDGRQPSPLTGPDPAPGRGQVVATIGTRGGIARGDGVSVRVPSGAVVSGSRIRVVSGNVPERSGESFGTPVGVRHPHPLRKPLRLTWRTSSLASHTSGAALLVKWEPKLRAWRPTNIALHRHGDLLTARVRHFSWYDVVVTAGQKVGEWTGSRVAGPECDGEPLPAWVQGTVAPGDDNTAAAIKVCFERDHDDVVTVRIANNRTFAQRIVMTRGGQRWKWTWPGNDGPGVQASVYSAAHAVLDSPTSFLVPAHSEVALGIARPARPGSVFIEATSSVDATTVLVDVIRFVMDQQSIGGAQNPYLNAFLQATYECGGKELLDEPETEAVPLVRSVTKAVADCGAELHRPGSEARAVYRRAIEQMTATRRISPDVAARAERLLAEADRAMAVLTYGEIAFYVSDQLANDLVGPLSWSIRGRGRPQELGAWDPSCASTATDSNRLYKNLALQDAFADTSRELWQFPTWRASARQAVQPLSRCSSDYRHSLAADLPSNWGDPRAAGVVADEILAMDKPTPAGGTAGEGAGGGAGDAGSPPSQGWNIGADFDSYCSVAWPTAPTVTSTAIHMVMTCSGVPSEFAFVSVSYPDPDLPVTPGTGEMRVRGRIADVGTSGYGFKELVVAASKITW